MYCQSVEKHIFWFFLFAILDFSFSIFVFVEYLSSRCCNGGRCHVHNSSLRWTRHCRSSLRKLWYIPVMNCVDCLCDILHSFNVYNRYLLELVLIYQRSKANIQHIIITCPKVTILHSTQNRMIRTKMLSVLLFIILPKYRSST